MQCYHNVVALLKVVKFNGPIIGKRFYGCAYWPRTYEFFKWADEVDDARELQYKLLERDTEIVELEMEKESLEGKMKLLRRWLLKTLKFDKGCMRLRLTGSLSMHVLIIVNLLVVYFGCAEVRQRFGIRN
ncbi:DNA topoisomerase 3 [Bienertia sinuspersici]